MLLNRIEDRILKTFRTIKSKCAMISFIVLAAIIVPPAHGASSIDDYPTQSKNLVIYFVDLSGSVDNSIVQAGLSEVRKLVASTYFASDAERKVPADFYSEWIPIQGAEASSPRIPLFTYQDDSELWAAAKTIKGKKNQILVLNKIWKQGGLWSRLLSTNGLNSTSCFNSAAQTLRSPGVSGVALSNLSKRICSIALRINNRFYKLSENVEAFTAGEKPVRTTNGSDVLGSIRKLENTARNSIELNNYAKVNLTFVSDMIHLTSTLNMEKELVNLSREAACAFGRQKGNELSGFNKGIFNVTIYGLGEKAERGASKSSRSRNEILYEPLREFWDCFWTAKGIDLPDSDIKSLSSFGRNS